MKQKIPQKRGGGGEGKIRLFIEEAKRGVVNLQRLQCQE
jgi:hypothetical protein